MRISPPYTLPPDDDEEDEEKGSQKSFEEVEEDQLSVVPQSEKGTSTHTY